LKIQQRWLPGINNALTRNVSAALMSYIVEAWVIFVQKALNTGELSDLSHDELFVASLSNNYEILKDRDIMAALAQFLSPREKLTHA
jgi:hypothetical protein